MDAAKRVLELLKSSGMRLVRQKKHLVYKHADGRSFVIAKTPSDFRAGFNQLRDLRRFLDIPRQEPVIRIRRGYTPRHNPLPDRSVFGGRGKAGKSIESQLASTFSNTPEMQNHYRKKRLLRMWKGTHLEVKELSRMIFN